MFIDLMNAFDKVWRGKLLEKLSKHGLSGNLYNSLASFLAQRFIRVKYQNGRSPYKQVKQGLPQGSVLSPILFDVMIDDVLETIQSVPGVKALLFADDLVLWATSGHIPGLPSKSYTHG